MSGKTVYSGRDLPDEEEKPEEPLDVSLNPFFICRFEYALEYECQVILRAADRMDARKKALVVAKHEHGSNVGVRHTHTEEVVAIAAKTLDGTIYNPIPKKKRKR